MSGLRAAGVDQGTLTERAHIPTPSPLPFPLKLQFPRLSPQAEILLPSLFCADAGTAKFGPGPSARLAR